MENQLDRAVRIAAEAHAGQKDKAGAPYILHALRVMMAVEPRDRVVAVLHDVVEDCPDYPLDRLAVAGFDPEVLGALAALTRRPGEAYTAFIERCGANPIARRVKLADLADNSDLSRIASPTTRDHERNAKYARAVSALTPKANAS